MATAAARRVSPIIRDSLFGTLTAMAATTTPTSSSCIARVFSSSSSHIPFSPKPFPVPLSSSSPSPSSSPLAILLRRRSFSSSSAGSIVVVRSSDELNSSLSKAQDDGEPSIFYFTASWCGPCRFISPVIEEMSKKYPHVTTYKVDIDLEGLGSTLSKLQIGAVPTFHFFQGGQKANEMVGADIIKLKETMESLYKWNRGSRLPSSNLKV